MVPLVIDTGKVLLLDLSNHTQQVQHALNEVRYCAILQATKLKFIKVSHISGVSSFTSQFWLKDDTTVMGSIQVELSYVSSKVEGELNEPCTETQLAVEKVQNVFMDQVSGLQQLSIQVDVS